MLNIRVPGIGPKSAKIVIVGEAPGFDEDKARQPFVGVSGRELDKSLGAAQIVRGTCYLTNVIKERPPSNDISIYIKHTGKGVWMSEVYNEYEAFLYKELNNLNPNIIVPLGNIGMWALTRNWGITKYRGSILRGVPELNGIKVIPTIHPAAALRAYMYKYYIAYDLNKVAKEAKFPEIKLPDRELKIGPSYDNSLQYLSSIKGTCAVDIEVLNYELSCICFAKSATDCMSIAFSHSAGEPFFPSIQEQTVIKAVAAVLIDTSIKKIFQNAMFDCSFLFEKYGIITRNIDDTMIAAGLLYPDFPKRLDFLSSIYTNEPYYKDEGKPGMRGEGSDERFWTYNAKDGAVTFEIMETLSKKLEEKELVSTYDRIIRCIPPLLYMQMRGIRVDTVKMQKAVDETEIEIQDYYDELDRLMGKEVPRTFATSPKQKKDYFYGELGIKPYLKDGKQSCNALALKRITRLLDRKGNARKGAREAKCVMEISRLRKLKGSYLEVNLDKDKRLRGSWNPIGTETGRFSCSQIWRG